MELIHNNWCQACKGTDNLSENSRQHRKDGIVSVHYLCLDCKNERRRKYYHTRGKAKIMEINKRYLQRKRDAKKASQTS